MQFKRNKQSIILIFVQFHTDDINFFDTIKNIIIIITYARIL